MPQRILIYHVWKGPVSSNPLVQQLILFVPFRMCVGYHEGSCEADPSLQSRQPSPRSFFIKTYTKDKLWLLEEKRTSNHRANIISREVGKLWNQRGNMFRMPWSVFYLKVTDVGSSIVSVHRDPTQMLWKVCSNACARGMWDWATSTTPLYHTDHNICTGYGYTNVYNWCTCTATTLKWWLACVANCKSKQNYVLYRHYMCDACTWSGVAIMFPCPLAKHTMHFP